MSKPYVITTCCDAKYGDFLIEHWLRSLRENVDLSRIDVVVLDYGLTDAQRATLGERGVRCLPCERNGFVCNLRYRDIVRLLDEAPYEQILSVDAGDVIFQSDISHLFELEPEHFRAVREEFPIPFFEALIEHDDVRPEHLQNMLDYLYDKRMLNCGVLLGSAARFREFWLEYQRLCHAFDCFGVDQFAFNYYAYRGGCYRALEPQYNFVLVSAWRPYRIRDGVFRDGEGRIIPIVHNAGNKPWSRAIDRFGYGPDRNRRKVVGAFLVRAGIFWLRLWTAFKRGLHRIAGRRAAAPTP